MSRFIANIGEKCYSITYCLSGVYRNAFILPHGGPFSCVLARSFAFCRGVVLGLSRRCTALGLVLACLGLGWSWFWAWMITSRVLAFAIFFLQRKHGSFPIIYMNLNNNNYVSNKSSSMERGYEKLQRIRKKNFNLPQNVWPGQPDRSDRGATR